MIPFEKRFLAAGLIAAATGWSTIASDAMADSKNPRDQNSGIQHSPNNNMGSRTSVGSRTESDRTSRESASRDNVRRDNTAVNERDRDGRWVTAQDQSQTSEALNTTKRIRQDIAKQTNLSEYAKNIKVITDDEGFVTLRGPVRNNAEKEAINQIAMNVAGTSQVRSQLEVVPSR